MSAQQRARRLYKSKNLRGAYERGALSAMNGHPASVCPYDEEPTDAATWRTTYRLAWMRGYESVPPPDIG